MNARGLIVCVGMSAALFAIAASQAFAVRNASASPKSAIMSTPYLWEQTQAPSYFSLDSGLRPTRLVDVSGSIVPGGPSQTITIPTAGDNARLTFDGIANQRVSLNLINVSIDYSYVSIQKPNGAGDLASSSVMAGGKFIDVVTLPSTGTYTIFVDPQSSYAGSMTLTLYDVPADPSGPITPGGVSVTTNTSTPGQNGRYTFSGAQGQRISIGISAVSLAPGDSYESVSLITPDGSSLAGSGIVMSSGWIDTQTLPTSGVYTVLVDPNGMATGTSTVTVYDVPPDVTGSITPSEAGDVSAPSTTTPGQNARMSFSGTQGRRVSLKISGVVLSDPNNSYENVSILKPDGSTLAGAGLVLTSGWIDTQTLPTTGTYTVFVDPAKGATATTTLAAYDVPPDFTGTLSLETDEATSETTTVPGQDARLTFSGVAGETVYVPRGGITTPLHNVRIFNPDGSFLAGTPLTGTQDGTMSATLPTGGTYTVVVDGYQDAIGQMTLAVSDEDALIGGLSADQSDASVVDPDLSPAAPQPISPSGPLAAGSYTTEVWSSSEVGNDRGLAVVSSTTPGTFTITGVVKDGTTQIPVSGAVVNVTAGSTSVSATTDADGAYAVANIPAESTQITVTPPGPYGTYQSTNSAPFAGTTYEQTIDLSTASVSEVDSPDAVDLSGQVADAAPNTDYYSQTRVPPTIDVRMLNLYPTGSPDQKNCKPLPGEPAPGNGNIYRPIKRYAFDYYVLRVAYEEIGSWDFNQVAAKAFFALAQNFAWVRKTYGGTFDVDNSTNFQCFRERKMVDRRWRQWLSDVLDERVATTYNRLVVTYYRGLAPVACTDSRFPRNGGMANQLVIKARSESTYNCPQETDWREIVKYFYASGTKVVAGRKPFLPTTGVTHTADSGLTIGFDSRFKNNLTFKNVAWKFRVFQRQSDLTWKQFRDVKWNGSDIPASLHLSPAQAAGTHRYRVRAWNPAGWSQASDVRDNGSLNITG